MRYLVIPQRPPGTEHMSEEELASLITRDSMIGVAKTRTGEALDTAVQKALETVTATDARH